MFLAVELSGDQASLKMGIRMTSLLYSLLCDTSSEQFLGPCDVVYCLTLLDSGKAQMMVVGPDAHSNKAMSVCTKTAAEMCQQGGKKR